MLELLVLLLKSPHLDRAYFAKPLLSAEECSLANAQLAADVLDRQTGPGLPKIKCNLLLGRGTAQPFEVS